MVNFLLGKIFREMLNEATLMAEIDVILTTSTSTNEIASFRFAKKIFIKRKLTLSERKRAILIFA